MFDSGFILGPGAVIRFAEEYQINSGTTKSPRTIGILGKRKKANGL
jgi:hypothetical protein